VASSVVKIPACAYLQTVSEHNQNNLKKLIPILYLTTLIFSCSAERDEEYKLMDDNIVDTKIDNDTVSSPEKNQLLNDCEFIYDTVSNEKYSMHLAILDKYQDKEKRGYFFKAGGDTLNHFLYHQDIAVFVQRLDSTESDFYRKLTNKVVFLILEQEPRMLDYGLTQWTREDKQLDYFMEHVSHPNCHTLPIDSIISIIKLEMGEPRESAERVKKRLIQNLEKGKTTR
jgi:hypothetical protein